MIFNIAVGISAAIISIGCAFLVLDREYEDGLCGRIALGIMSLCGFGRAATLIENGFRMELSWIGSLLWLSLAIFMARHIYRFVRWKKKGEFEWRHPAGSNFGKLSR